jgi:phenylpyruvate tautomerase PptA (4-oxalocrotonate tautomerase family)
MPVINVSIIEGKNDQYRRAVLEGIHKALVDNIHIPDSDRTQKIQELKKADFETSPGRTDRFTLIEISLFQGRSLDAKKALFSGIVANLKKNPGIDPEDVMIILNETIRENWGLRGGKPASEIDLGFKVDV